MIIIYCIRFTIFMFNFNDWILCYILLILFNTIVKSRYKMLPYAGYVDPESTLAIGVIMMVI